MRQRGLLISTLALALLVGALVPGMAGAKKLGTPHFDYGDIDYGSACGLPSTTCLWMQRKLPGGTLKAPFSGTIRKWHIATPTGGTYALVVMRKQGGGEFKAVRGSDNESVTPATAPSFETNLKIRRGDRVAVFGPGFAVVDNAGGRRTTFNPPPVIGGSAEPGDSQTDELLYNATIKR
jgi:hypothetical protein